MAPRSDLSPAFTYTLFFGLLAGIAVAAGADAWTAAVVWALPLAMVLPARRAGHGHADTIEALLGMQVAVPVGGFATTGLVALPIALLGWLSPALPKWLFVVWCAALGLTWVGVILALPVAWTIGAARLLRAPGTDLRSEAWRVVAVGSVPALALSRLAGWLIERNPAGPLAGLQQVAWLPLHVLVATSTAGACLLGAAIVRHLLAADPPSP